MLTLIIFLFVLGLIIFVSYRQFVNHCEYLMATVPEIEVVPGSEALGEPSITRTGEEYSLLPTLLGAADYGKLTAGYVTDTNFEDVISFYEQLGECHKAQDSKRVICYGPTQPFGSFYIGIDPPSTSSKTRFFIELRWSFCTDEI